MFSTQHHPRHVQELYTSINTISDRLKTLSPTEIDLFHQKYPGNQTVTSITAQQSQYSTFQPSLKTSIHPLNSPIFWRHYAAVSSALTAIDLPFQVYSQIKDKLPPSTQSSINSKIYNNGEENHFSTLDLVFLYEYIGRISLNCRDALGLAHSRILLQSLQEQLRHWGHQPSIEPQSDSSCEQLTKKYKENIKTKHNEYVLSVFEQIVNGSGYCAISITEPSCGTDVSAMNSYSTPVYDINNNLIGFNIFGKKEFNARLEQCTHLILFTKNNPGSGLNAFCIPMNELISHPLININTNTKCFFQIHSTPCYSLHGNSFGGIEFDNIFIPITYLICSQGDGHLLFRNHFSLWRLFQISSVIGTTIHILIQCISYIRERIVFDQTLSTFSHIQQDIAKYTTQLRMGQLLIQDIAIRIDSNHQRLDDFILGEIAMAKSEIVDNCISICFGIQQIYGARGLCLHLTDVSQRLLDLQGLSIADGTSAAMRSLVMRHCWGEDFWDSLFQKQQKQQKQQKSNQLIQQPSLSYPNTYTLLTQHDMSIIYNIKLIYSHCLLKTTDFEQLTCLSAGGPCPTVAASNLFQLIYYRLFKQFQQFYPQKDSQFSFLLDFTTFFKPINLVQLLGIIYPEVHQELHLDNIHIDFILQFLQSFPIPYIPDNNINTSTNTIQKEQILVTSYLYPNNQIITQCYFPQYRHLQPIQTTDDNIDVIYYPYLLFQTAHSDGEKKKLKSDKILIQPLFNLFSHGRLTNEAVVWFLHTICINYITNNRKSILKQKKQEFYQREYKLLEQLLSSNIYYISVYTHEPIVQHCFTSYPPKDNNLFISESLQYPNHYLLESNSIECSCRPVNIPPFQSQINMTQIKSLFSPLYHRDLSFSSPDSLLPIDFNHDNYYHNTYYTNYSKSLTLEQFYSILCHNMNITTITSSTHQTKSQQLLQSNLLPPQHLTLLSFNWYPSRSLEDLTGRHFIVVKEVTRNVSSTGSPQIIISACDPNAPMKDFVFIAQEFELHLNNKISTAIELLVPNSSSNSAKSLKLVGSIFNLSIFHKPVEINH